MYPVSEAYKIAINKKTRITKMTGAITLSDGTVLSINDAMIAEGGFEITNQCVSGNTLQIGSIYAGQLSLSIKTDINRNKFQDAVITPVFNLLLPDNTFEQVPLGVFSIDSANRIGKNIAITAYDSMMTEFDKRITTSLTGFTVLQMLEFIETKRKIKISPDTINNIVDLAPSTAFGELIVLKPTKLSSEMSYRNLLSFISEMCGGFAYINRLGEIEIKRYSKTPDKSIDDSIRNSSEFSDFECEIGTIVGKYYTKNKKKVEITVEEKTVFNSNAASYTLSDNPYFQRESDADKRKMVYKNIEEALKDIVYTPCEVSYLGDPALELGDCVECTGYNTNNTIIHSLIHVYIFSYRKSCKIKCVGSNQKLAKVSDMSGIGSSSNGESGGTQMYYRKYINGETIVIGSEMVPIATCPINVGDGDSISVSGGITFDVTAMGTFSIVYSLNNIYDAYNPKQYVPYSAHPCHIPLNFLIEDIDTNAENTFKVYILSEDGGTGTIQASQSLVVLSSQTIADTVPGWDGKLAFAERIVTGFTVGPVVFNYDLEEEHKEIYNPNIKIYEGIISGYAVGPVEFNFNLSTAIKHGHTCESVSVESISALPVGAIGFNFTIAADSGITTP